MYNIENVWCVQCACAIFSHSICKLNEFSMLCFYEREKNKTWAKFFIGSKIQLKIFDTWDSIQLFHYIVAKENLDFVGIFSSFLNWKLALGGQKMRGVKSKMTRNWIKCFFLLICYWCAINWTTWLCKTGTM